MSSRNRIVIVLVTVVAFAIGVWLWSRPPQAPQPPAPARVAVVAPTPTAAQPTATPQQTTRRAGAASPQVSAASATPAPAETQKPYASMAITDGLDPIAKERELQVGKSQGRDAKNPRLIAFPSLSSFEAPSPIVIYAYLAEDIERERDGKKEITPDSRKVGAREIRGELRAPDGTSLTELRFHDDGKNGDAEAGDDFFTATYEPEPERALDMNGEVTLVVNAKTLNGESRSATTTFLYSVPAARLTGNYKDELVDGHLRISAEVEVDEPGTFDLEATIADEKAQFIAWAHNAVQLDEGKHWIPLTYSGKIFREHGVDGPYLVWSLALSTISREPPERNDVVPNALRTKPYTVDQFSDTTFE